VNRWISYNDESCKSINADFTQVLRSVARSLADGCAIYGGGVFTIRVQPLNICIIRNLWLQKILHAWSILAHYLFAFQRSADLKSALSKLSHDIEKSHQTCSRMERDFAAL
jgi:hypothetical protein